MNSKTLLPLFVILFLAFLIYNQNYVILIALGMIITAVLTLVYFKQNSLLYMPQVPGLPLSPADNPRGYRHPSNHRLNSLDISLNTSDGITIKGWHILSQNSDKIIVYFHENAGNIGTRIPYVRELSAKTGSDVIMIAYRGYSDSQGVPSEEGLQKDAKAVLEYALDHAREEKKKVYLLGRSLGGAVTVFASTLPQYQDQISGIILENTFTSISDMVDSILPVLSPFKFLQRNHWKSIDHIGRIRKPILFIMSMQDELVPPAQMQRLRNEAVGSQYVQVYQIEDGTHNSSWDVQSHIYFPKLNAFFEKCSPGSHQSDDMEMGESNEEL